MLAQFGTKVYEVQALATWQKLRLPPGEVCGDAARRHWAGYRAQPFGQLDWDAPVRRLDVEDAAYRT